MEKVIMSQGVKDDIISSVEERLSIMEDTVEMLIHGAESVIRSAKEELETERGRDNVSGQLYFSVALSERQASIVNLAAVKAMLITTKFSILNELNLIVPNDIDKD